MDHKVEIREIEPIRAAYMKYRGDAAKANRMFPKVFQSVRGKTNGSPFFSYLSMDPETKMGNMELCVPTQETPAGSSVNVKVFPRIRRSASHIPVPMIHFFRHMPQSITLPQSTTWF